jgi:hypothetical protein
MPKTLIHVNRAIIQANAKKGEANPPLTVKRGGRRVGDAHRVTIRAEDGREVAAVVYSPDKPLSCGARCWIETELAVELEPTPATPGNIGQNAS